MFFSDLHVQLLSRGILNPGEQLVSQTVTSYRPWWAFGLIQRQHLVLATDQRVVLVDHRLNIFRASQYVDNVESIPWSGVNELKVTGLFTKKLRIKGSGDRGPVNHKFKIPNTLFGLLAPMKNNMQGARSVAAAQAQFAQGAQQLGAAPMMPLLGAAQQAYVQSPYGAPPSYGQPPMPAVNAPGYNSVPPPSQGQYGAPQGQFGAPMPSPFDPPPRSY